MPNSYKIKQVKYSGEKFPKKPWEVTRNGLPVLKFKNWLEARSAIKEMLAEEAAYEAEKNLLDRKKNKPIA